jgi:uncharacterized protein (UPF0276 family)
VSLPGYLGHGVGLRVPHYERALAGGLDVDFVEVITENFFGAGGRPRAVLEAVRRDRPLVLHGVSLGVGSLGGPDFEYLRRVKALADAFEPAWVSDHVCWTRLDGQQSHELLPLPHTREALELTVRNTQRVQDFLGRPLLLENVSSYVSFAASEMSEWEFLSELARQSGCFLLLDCNNILVSAHNHGFSPLEYLAGLPPTSVAQLHLANHSLRPGYRFDDHRGPVPEDVWSLFEVALRRFGPVSSIVEWDEDLPTWERLAAEAGRARSDAQRVLGAPSGESPAPLNGVCRVLPSPTGTPPATSTPPGGTTPERPHTLERTQRLLFAALTWPEGVADFVRAGGEPTRTELLATCLAHGGLGAIERLDIYANAYFYRLLGALREVYPRLGEQLGETRFHNLVTGYLLEHPSTSPDLTDLAEQLPAYLRAHQMGRGSGALPDLAQLELALARALHAPDRAPLTRTDLLGLAPSEWPGLELRLVPSACCLTLQHDVTTPAAQGTFSERAGAVLVARRDHAAYFRRLDLFEGLALDHLNRARTFESLCERLGQAGAEPSLLVEYLERWVSDGLVERLS